VPLHVFLRRVGADLRARYVAFTCFDGYSTSIDMASALHPQTTLALDFKQQPLLRKGARRSGSASRSSSALKAPRSCNRSR
jgi:DMSO/TMAO reductase YedYZ molybdopterin-dependent catalytic subunit